MRGFSSVPIRSDPMLIFLSGNQPFNRIICGVNRVNISQLILYFRIFDVAFMHQIIKIEAHESEVLCIEYSSPDAGNGLRVFVIALCLFFTS